MHHLLYKTTNKINGHIYIGVHSTHNENDGYLGSGLDLKEAITRYGRDNFFKEIIGRYPNREDLLYAERNIVNKDFVERPDTYNRVLGGGTNTPTAKHTLDFRRKYYRDEAKEIAKHYKANNTDYQEMSIQWVLREMSKIYFVCISNGNIKGADVALGLISRHLCTADVCFTGKVNA